MSKKNNKSKPLNALLIALVIFIFIPVAAIGALVPTSSKSQNDENSGGDMDFLKDYYDAAATIGADYIHLVAYDMILHSNDLTNVNPYESVIMFLSITVDEYYYRTEYIVVEDQVISYQVKTFLRTVTREGHRAVSYLSNINQTNYSNINDVLVGLRELDANDLYDVNINSRHIDDLIHVFSEEQREWLNAIFESNIIALLYSPTDAPNFDASLIPFGFFRKPNVNLNYVTSPYGYRMHPIKKVKLFHAGVDLVSRTTTTFDLPLNPVASGEIVRVQHLNSGYGNSVLIRHIDSNNNEWFSLYGHMNKIYVSTGETVNYNTVLGTVGNSGSSTGPHLHLEIKFGNYTVDPRLILGY